MHSAIVIGSVDRNIDTVVQNTIDVLASKYDFVYISAAFRLAHDYENVIRIGGEGNIEFRIRERLACDLIKLNPLKGWFDIIVLPFHGSLTRSEIIRLLSYECCRNIISVNNALNFDLNPRLSDCLLPN